MKRSRTLFAAFIVALLAQGCATTASKHTVAKKKKMPPRMNESFALVEDGDGLDEEILKRGNKVRGLSEY